MQNQYLQGIQDRNSDSNTGMAYCAISMVLTRMISGMVQKLLQRRESEVRLNRYHGILPDGFAAALNAFIAQNYGGKNDRVKKDIRLLCGRLVSGDC